MSQVVIIGAGVGGLTAAAALSASGLDVTVLEAHVYPGGCAGTFYHKGYRFDAGATLAGGFYPDGPMDKVARATGIEHWPARPASLAMVVHLPGQIEVSRWADRRRWEEYRRAFGVQDLAFWRWQESTADALWELALRLPPWPPQSLADATRLSTIGLDLLGKNGHLRQIPELAADALRPVSNRLRGASDQLRLFVDAQLLISTQTESQSANALYGAAALDLPRRGVVHLEGGIGAIAQLLAEVVKRHGGRILYRQEAVRIRIQDGRPVAVETRHGDYFPTRMVIANLPPWNVVALLGEDLPPQLRHLPAHPDLGWGAFVLYVGLDASAIPNGFPLHHQIVLGRPLSEGNSVFLSLSPSWDITRAPVGKRALTLSTHTNLRGWWELLKHDQAVYKACRGEYAKRLLVAGERALPSIRAAAELILPGTPVTFARFTRRSWGWVGGFPQTSLLQARGPRLGPGLWMVGDSIFPGQSTAATALGGLRVASSVLAEWESMPTLTQNLS